MIFGRRKKNQETSSAAEAPVTGQDQDGQDQDGQVEAVEETPAVSGRAATGPFDVSEKETPEGYVDLGALRIAATENLQLRLEVEERTKRVIAVTLDINGSNLQLQAFAAPRSEGLWDEIRGQIAASVGSQGGTVEERAGEFGTELIAKLPAQTPDGRPGFRVARFVGVDGPRWFLRGVFGGPAAMDPQAAEPVERLFRNVVVVRGDHPLPPRELLQLRLPKDAAGKKQQPEEPKRLGDDPLRRGPEITHIG
ncbi:DUF3710 domain-containing protein [Arthrobacter sp. JZ12]|uniref:DUF3710 domain-containing protein n=1 Tax=Arthrobacter sp. JZ12 TaxID=2654190 RepID=UPI002B48F5DE|nr:DUF3710 domain-containing protein [Arthrobacter sp. JZ12]WRH24780.1 DUF3710 domain-containing protein [Arthrobacter sp. JZ12]